jgi:hypothetical protein
VTSSYAALLPASALKFARGPILGLATAAARNKCDLKLNRPFTGGGWP